MTIRAQVGKNATGTIGVSNAEDNISLTIQNVDYAVPEGVSASTASGLSLTLQPYATGGSFQVEFSLSVRT